MQKRFFISSYLSLISTLILVALLYYFFRHTFFIILFVFILALPAISYAYSKSIFQNLKTEISFYPYEAVKFGECELNLEIINPSRFPFPSFMLTFYVQNPIYKERIEQTHVIPIKAGENSFTFPISLNKCGIYEAGIMNITGFDLFHFFAFTKEVDITSTVRVFPERPASNEPHEALYSEGFDEFEESSKTGNVSSNVTDIREYRPGDRLQRIHWKLSQKIDKLMVKENESTSTHEFYVLTELYQPDFSDCKNDPALYHALDEAFEYTSSISQELLNMGQPFMFSVYSTRLSDFLSFRIRSKEDLNEAFCAAFYEPTYTSENLAKEVYENAGYNKGTLIHVTHRGIEDA